MAKFVKLESDSRSTVYMNVDNIKSAILRIMNGEFKYKIQFMDGESGEYDRNEDLDKLFGFV